ncbi:MAG: hypothetical protein K0S04_1063 [Herbinix sp.]|jgi:N-acetylmuramoyl-L-alanine amidase|nr:hypothetical protein [Herbinix sp.]
MIRINVDAGHGSYTSGKRTPPMPVNVDFDGDGVVDVKKGNTIKEHFANVKVAMLLVEELKRCGFAVTKTGFDDADAGDDTDVLISSRQKTVKNAACDYSVSIHFNAYGDGQSFNSAQGASVYIHSSYPKDSRKLATKVLNQLMAGTKQKNLGVLTANLGMCNCKLMNTKAAILVETAFMTNQNEAINMMGKKKFWEEAAIEIAKGLCEYTGVTYVKKPAETKPATLYRVHAGSYTTESEANKAAEQLKKKGFKELFVYSAKVSGKTVYRVQLGIYSSKENADKMLARAKAAGFTKAFTLKS